jgi:hypothetical protein
VADRHLHVQTQSAVMRSVVLRRRSRARAITIKVRLTRLRLVERQLAHAAYRSVAFASAACTRVRRIILSSLVTQQLDVALPLRVRTLYVVMHSVAHSRAARITFTRVHTRESLVVDLHLHVQTQSAVMRNVMHSRSRVQPTTSTSRITVALRAVQQRRIAIQRFAATNCAARMFALRCMSLRMVTRRSIAV